MRMILRFLLVLVVAALGSGCRPTASSSDGWSVVASAYPIAEAAERVGGDLVRVRDLTPPGVEPHDLELTPEDLAAIVGADLVLYVGGGFQPAVEDAVAQAQGRTLDVLSVVPTLPADGGVDPHVWLDPLRYAEVVAAVARALGKLDPAHAATYRSNAEAFEAELHDLDAAYRRGLASCRSRLLVVSHAAFGYLAQAYGLREVAITGVSPESEPDPARLAELRTLIEDRGVTTIFTEELVSPAVAEALARETGARVAVLSPLEGLTEREIAAGADYLSIMRRNLRSLEMGLGCT